jgi:hypothetical protein
MLLSILYCSGAEIKGEGKKKYNNKLNAITEKMPIKKYISKRIIKYNKAFTRLASNILTLFNLTKSEASVLYVLSSKILQ